MELLEALPARVRESGLLLPGGPLVVGVSGGPDSLCLLDCLRRLGHRPIVAHFDHGLRPESAAEAQQVARLADAWDLPFEGGRADVRAARGGRGSLEEAGRLLRYQFLVDVAGVHQAPGIATGHTADDQVETVLMHLLRGAGSSGLRGMPPSSDLGEWNGIRAPAGLRLIRPLLTTWRAEVERYCALRGLEPMRDPSNLDPRHFRNRLRHKLLPLLEDYNPQVRQSLFRTAQIMAAECELLDRTVQAAWPRCVRAAGAGCLAMDREAVLREPLAVRRRLVLRVVYALRPNLRDVGFEAVQSILDFVADPGSRRQTVVGDLELIGLGPEVALRQPDSIIRFPWYPQLKDLSPTPLKIPGSLDLADGWALRAARTDLTPAAHAELTSGDRRRLAAIDADRVHGRLTVRPPASGDRIRPLGMQGSVKVADLFGHRSIPWPARARWPLLVDEVAIIWVAGLHLSREHRLQESSRQALTFRLQSDHEAHRAPGPVSGGRSGPAADETSSVGIGP